MTAGLCYSLVALFVLHLTFAWMSGSYKTKVRDFGVYALTALMLVDLGLFAAVLVVCVLWVIF